MNILITGATSGIGKALAVNYSAAGHQILACGRSKNKLDALEAEYDNIQPLCFDLTEFDNYPELKDGEELDLLILNAGDCEYIDNPLHFDAKMFERVININLISIGYALEKWLKHIKPGGRLVVVSSSAGLIPLPRAEAYGTSKAALTYLTHTLAATLKKSHVNVSVVLPGFVETPLTDRNTFSMPMIVTVDEATKQIITGIEKGKSEISFPKVFIFIMKCLRLLPSGLWQRLATRMT